MPFRGHRDDKVDFLNEDSNRGNYVAALQFQAKSDSLLEKHLISTAKRNAKYTSITIQNQITHITTKIREHLIKPVKEKSLPFTIIADETTDGFSNQEILTLCLRYVDVSLPRSPKIKECLLSFIHHERERQLMAFLLKFFPLLLMLLSA